MTRPRVFVVNEPTRVEDGAHVRPYNLAPAAEYGEVVPVFPPGPPPYDPSSNVETIRRKLASIGPDDFILPIGHMALIAATAAIAARNTYGVLNVLIWDNRAARYFPHTYRLWDDCDARPETSQDRAVA